MKSTKTLKKQNVQDVLDKLTLQEKIRLLNGVGSWYTSEANGKLPALMMTDGPHGLRKQGKEQNLADINDSIQSTCFPTASCVANSWDLDLMHEMSGAIADQALSEEVGIVLGCGMNIKRSPMCGRNFEYFSEDPLLAGSLAASYIDGMQSKNVGTSIKHFCCNNQETRRQSSDSIVDQRALREIYLRPFEIAVRNTQPATIMASYNKVNGKYSCLNNDILTGIVRNEWGFQGAFVSDWGAAVNISDCIKAGLDLAMPDSGGYQPDMIQKAYDEGRLSEDEINRSAAKVIEIIQRFSGNSKIKVDYSKHHQIARKIAGNSAVLLKNEGVLPISDKQKDIVVLGQMAEGMRFQGGGSSHINAFTGPNAIESLKAAGFNVHYAAAYPADDKVESTTPEQFQRLAQEAVALAKEAEIKKMPVLLFCGLTNRTEGEGFDRHDMNLPLEQLTVIKKIIQMNKNITVVAFGGSPFAMPFINDVAAVLHMYLAGEAVGEACVDLLTGKVNPSGKLSESYPFSEKDVPSKATWGKEIPGIEYRESIFTGYRFYDTFNVPVQYEFGFGLSYTKFSYTGLEISVSDFDATDADSAIGNVGATCGYAEGLSKSKKNIKVKFTVKNVGKVAGAEVVQLYVKNPKADYLRPSRELRGFTKVFLEPGKSKKVTIELDAKAFSMFDVNSNKYIAPSGTYEIQVAASLNDVKLKKTIKVKGVKYAADDREKLPSYFVALDQEKSKAKGKTKTVAKTTAKAKVVKSLEKEKKVSVNIDDLFTHEDFAKLYGAPLPEDPSPSVGTYSILNNMNEAAELSPLCKKIRDKVVQKMINDARKQGRSENDPAVKIGVAGSTENPLESIILLSARQYNEYMAEAMVNLCNNKKIAALKSFLKSGKKNKK